MVAYIGTYNSGAAKISMPILNRAALLMVSPANTYVGLTKPGLGEKVEPAIYRPSKKINYFRVVPADERSASLALGSTKWQTIVHVVLPIAIPGLVTGIILTAGRIFGEAAALLFTAGLSTPTHYDFGNLNLTDPRSPWSPFHPATTLSVYIWKINSEGLGQFVRQVADTSAAVLVLMVLIFNLGARGLGCALQRRVIGA